MTTSSERMAGTPGYVTLDGVQYRMSPLRPADFAEARSYFRSKYPDPLVGLAERIKDLPVEVQQKIGMQAYEDSKTWGDLRSTEGLRWASSVEGMAFFFWLSIRRHHSDVAFEKIISLFEKEQNAKLEEFMDRLETLTGLADENAEVKKSQESSRKDRRAREAALRKKKKATSKKTGK